ncbi:MAG: hypothetical protein [Cressdnaviricota sp.]|nr:MAG: hypothetical protein [Cressdnaviricota sp.]
MRHVEHLLWDRSFTNTFDMIANKMLVSSKDCWILHDCLLFSSASFHSSLALLEVSALTSSNRRENAALPRSFNTGVFFAGVITRLLRASLTGLEMGSRQPLLQGSQSHAGRELRVALQMRGTFIACFELPRYIRFFIVDRKFRRRELRVVERPNPIVVTDLSRHCMNGPRATGPLLIVSRV